MSVSSYSYLTDDGDYQSNFSFEQLFRWWKMGFFEADTTFRNDQTNAFIDADLLFAGSPDAFRWFYRDDEGVVQGPHQHADMRLWLAAGYFDSHTLIRHEFESDSSLVALAEHKLFNQLTLSERSEATEIEDEQWKILIEPANQSQQQQQHHQTQSKSDSSTRSSHSDSHSSSSVSPQWFGPYSGSQMRYWFATGWLRSSRLKFQSTHTHWTTHSNGIRNQRAAANKLALALSEFPQSNPPSFVLPHLSVSPFTYLSELNEYWRYQDRDGIIRGPFSTSQMRFWLDNGLFLAHKSLRIQSIDPITGVADEFRPLEHRFCSFAIEKPNWQPSEFHGFLDERIRRFVIARPFLDRLEAADSTTGEDH